MCYDAFMNLKDLLQLAGEQGRVVIVGDDGEVKGVLVSYDEYVRSGAAAANVKPTIDPETINREILEAQLKDNVDLSIPNIETIPTKIKMPESIGQILQARASTLFVSQPAPPTIEEFVYDPREEVTDPNAGRLSGPRIAVEEEEIKPNFDDI